MQKDGFDRIFNEHEEGTSARKKKAIEEVAEALLQRNHQYQYYSSSFRDLRAFQAVVTTIYDSFLNKISGLAQTALAPLAKWGGSKGPVTFPITSTKIIPGVNAGIVNLPPEYRTGGLLAWATLGHEVGGHNFLRSIPGTESDHTPKIIKELQDVIYTSVKKCCDTEKIDRGKAEKLAGYWSACAEEAASDVLGAMSIGPAFGIGLVGLLKGERNGRLNVSGPLHSKNKGSMKLLKFSTDSQDVFVKKISGNITFKKESGLFGYCQAPGKSERTTEPINYKKVFFSAGKHPVDVLRIFVIIRVIELFIEHIGEHILELVKEHTEHIEHTEYSIKLLTEHKKRIEQDHTVRIKSLKQIQDDWRKWIKIIDEEVKGDLQDENSKKLEEISFEELDLTDLSTKPFRVPIDLAIKTARTTAVAVATTQLSCLKKCLMDIVSWKEEDEQIVDGIRKAINDENCTKLPYFSYNEKSYARHIIAASVLESLETSSDPHRIEMIFNKMKEYLICADGRIQQSRTP